MAMDTITRDQVEQAYELAKRRYAPLGVDTDAALATLQRIPISIHCWQGDDVGGFETPDSELDGGGLQVTGNYPGKATNPAQLRQDLDAAMALIPGTHRLNLHAIYADTDGDPVDRDQLAPQHFQTWIDWCRERGMGMDFNPTFFSHPQAESGFTLSSPDERVRNFWIRHGQACRRISQHIGRELAAPCVMNTWVPDGFKDIPVDRNAARERLRDSLDRMLSERMDPAHHLDAVESKLFGIGAESCTIGSHEFYLGYAVRNGILVCLDAGHFHPTEVISDKISACLQFLDRILLHVSRPVRWDSDHVVIYDDELQAIGHEIVRGGFLDRVHIGLDFFDATINRVAAWVIGTRSLLKALCRALLEPVAMLRGLENAAEYTARLAILEELKSMPFTAVWDYHCLASGVPVGIDWLEKVAQYEKEVFPQRVG
jgi:L-rhamnose isomerase